MKLNSRLFHLIWLLFVIVLLNYSEIRARENYGDYDVLNYRLAIQFFPTEESLSGTLSIFARSTAVKGLSELALDLINNLQVDSVSGPVAGFQHENNQIKINLNRTFAANELFEIQIKYHGQPAKDGTFSPVLFSHQRNRRVTETISTESCPYYARYWWPCKDTPDDKPDSVNLFVTVPAELEVAANGILISAAENPDGTRTHHWQIKNPIATYLITVQIADYSLLSTFYVNRQNDTLDIYSFVFPEDLKLGQKPMLRLPKMLEALEHYFGAYPYWNEKYGMAEYLGEWAAMEYQTLSCFSRDYLADTLTVLHELSHQWFGDCVTPANFHHTWISEGFAVLSEALYLEYLHGTPAYHNYMNSDVVDAHRYRELLFQADISTAWKVYPSVVYYKGAWVLHMLRHYLGDSVFFGSLRKYLKQFGYSSALTEDLQQVFEQQSGRNLDTFFRQWVYEAGYPEFYFGWSVKELTDGTFHLSGFIDQRQSSGPPVFELPVDVTVEFETGDTTLCIFCDEQAEKLEFIFPQKPKNLVLDKMNWVLKSTKQVTSAEIEVAGYQVLDAQGNGNGRADPAESVALALTLENLGLPLLSVSATLSTDDPDIFIQNEKSIFETLPHRTPVTNQANQFQFRVSETSRGHLSWFQLRLSGPGGFEKTLSFSVKIGPAPTLLIDDDESKSYQYLIEPLFEAANLYAETWDVLEQGTPVEVLQNYTTIFWLTGDSRERRLSSEEKNTVQDFLQKGGRVLFSGQNLAAGLALENSTEDSLFLADLLKVTFHQDSTGALAVMGFASQILPTGTQLLLNNGQSGTPVQSSVDAVEPIPPAQAFLNSIPGNRTVGVFYENKETRGRLIFLTFDLKGISGPSKQSTANFIKQLHNWLAGTSTDAELILLESVPEIFDLSQNFPNPFNPRTTIEFQVPRASRVFLEIYNVQGQRVCTLVDEVKLPGCYRMNWEGKTPEGDPVASGQYFLLLRAGDFVETKKMLVVR